MNNTLSAMITFDPTKYEDFRSERASLRKSIQRRTPRVV
jgi:hypothetical protein